MPGKFIGSGRQKEGGFLAVHKKDFKAHIDGTEKDYNHSAESINMSPPIDIFNNLLNAETLQETLEKMANVLANSGQGFISIGDGYEAGDFNVGDPGIATLNDAFAHAFAADRLQNGGIILLKAGTYYLYQNVQVPPGITIMGEPTATNIIGEMSEEPMFTFPKVINMHEIEPGATAMAQPSSQNKLWGLTLFDNLDGNIAGGGPSMSAVPMIDCKRGSNVVIDGCFFVGKAVKGPVSVTHRGVGYSGNAGGQPTTLHVKNSYFDGIKTPIDFDTVEGEKDYLIVENNRARSLGGGSLLPSLNERSFVAFTTCNATLVSNFHEGLNDDWGASVCFLIKNVIVNSENVSISIVGNSGKISGSLNPSFIENANKNNFIVDSRAIKTDLRIITSGNSWGLFDDNFELKESINEDIDNKVGEVDNKVDEVDNKLKKLIACGTVPIESLKGNRSFIAQNQQQKPNVDFYNIHILSPTENPIIFEGGSLFNVAHFTQSYSENRPGIAFPLQLPSRRWLVERGITQTTTVPVDLKIYIAAFCDISNQSQLLSTQIISRSWFGLNRTDSASSGAQVASAESTGLTTASSRFNYITINFDNNTSYYPGNNGPDFPVYVLVTFQLPVNSSSFICDVAYVKWELYLH